MSQLTSISLILFLCFTAVHSEYSEEPSYPEDTVKSGICPVPPEQCFKAPDPNGGCANKDSQCPGKKKCCVKACEYNCVDPENVKSGICPVPPEKCKKEPDPNGGCANKDSQCPGKKKCCVKACEYACVDPENVEKSGSCPHVGPPGTHIGIVCKSVDKTACKNDGDCKGKKKCCSEMCVNKCRDPAEETPLVKSGLCPVPPEQCFKEPDPNGGCANKDSQCPGTKKCCVKDCEYACLDPDNKKPGSCPAPITRCINPPSPNSICTKDSQCPGNKKCCVRTCDYECLDPENDSAGP